MVYVHQVSIGVTSGEGFGGWFEIGVQLLCEGRRRILWDTRTWGMPGGYKDRGGGADNGEGCYKCGKHGHFARLIVCCQFVIIEYLTLRECEDWRHGRRDQEDITKEFKTWNYGSTQGGQGSHGGYTDYQDPAGHGHRSA